MKLFFDVDGVLIKGFSQNPLLHYSWNETIDADLGIDREKLQKLFFQKRFDDVIIGKADLETEMAAFLSEINSTVKAKTVIAYWLEKDAIINEYVFDWIENSFLPKHNLYVATNQEKNRANYLWHGLKFCNVFSDIFYSADIGYSKNQPEFFLNVRNRTGFKPEECLIIDDSESVINTALACNWNAVLFTGEESLNKVEEISSGRIH